jgi:hypothetical protein
MDDESSDSSKKLTIAKKYGINWDELSSISDDLLTSYSSQIYTSIAPTINSGIITTSTTPWNTYTLKCDDGPYFHANPVIRADHRNIDIKMDDGSVVTLSREELIKYISEQQLVRENELIHAMYERYQVAVKLVRSDDDGDEGN